MSHQVYYIDRYNIAGYNKAIAILYRNVPALKTISLSERVMLMSTALLGRSYVIGAAGEGHEGRFDQAPLYRLDAFDCVTYVNTVLALALSYDVVSFRKNLVRISYRDAQLAYSHRHHFMSVDWNFHNQTIDLVKDITPEIVDADERPIAKNAEALIDRPNWFRHRTYQDIRLLQRVSPSTEKKLLQELHAIAKQVKPERSHLSYLPLSEMFDAHSNPKSSIFKQIPQGAIVEIVRPDWDLRAKIGTNLDVSHVGFAIWQDNDLFYRQASSIEKQVIDIPLADYLQYRLMSPSVKGINVQALLSA